MKKKFLLFSLFLTSMLAFAQQNEANVAARRYGQILVQISPNTNIESVAAHLTRALSKSIQVGKPVAPDWGIWLLEFDENQVSSEQLLSTARHCVGVMAAQWNHATTERDLEPNDANWYQQDDMKLIEAPTAWEFSTGGVHKIADDLPVDTIVVAVLEKGILFSHPDLAPNRWYNRAEIPKNGIDDDANGYIDDYAGWNPRYESDSLGTRGTHGTSVSGIIGAKGNNGTGVTGVNWDVKMMALCNIEFEDEIIAGYNYVGKMRRLYNESNGQKGAFVVATNASFGLDFAKAADHPLWCAVYDSLGKIGVLNIGATSNQNVNVDVQGDMPTTCTSEFLIAVTNTDKLGNKISSAGYGSTSIDLGAPGTTSHTTVNSGNLTADYGGFGGTSAATPHVTGSVALLYSMGCNQFTNDAISNPVTCARRVRDIILNNAEPNSSLSGKTTTGGLLNLGNALNGILDVCDGVVGQLDVLEVRTTPDGDRFFIFYQTPNFEKYQFRVFNALGQLMYEQELQPKQFQANYVEFDASFLRTGVYIMSVGRGKVQTARKFFKF
jgi:serine protease